MLSFKNGSRVIIPLLLLSMTTVFGDGNANPQMAAPKPKEIKAEAYNPQYYNLKDRDNGGYITAEFLYWYARETNLDIGSHLHFIQQPISPLDQPLPPPPPGTQPVLRRIGFPTKHQYVEGNWDPGFRVGIGWNTNCDGWDVNANYTYFHNKGRKSTKSLPITSTDINDPAAGLAATRNEGYHFLSDPWANAVGGVLPLAFETIAGQTIGDGLFLTDVNTLTGKWKLFLNQVDLEVGNRYWIRKTFNIRPYFGLRGAWTRTNFVVKGVKTEDRTVPLAPGVNLGPGTYNIMSNHFKNKFWGVGLLGGLEPEFRFSKSFGLYGNISGALLWGKYKAENRFNFFQNIPISVGDTPLNQIAIANPKETDQFTRMQGILDLAIGLRWEETWCNDRYSTALDLGWEHHYWFDFGMYHRAIGANDLNVFSNPVTSAGVAYEFNQSTSNLTTNLGFGGLVARFRFDF